MDLPILRWVWSSKCCKTPPQYSLPCKVKFKIDFVLVTEFRVILLSRSEPPTVSGGNTYAFVDGIWSYQLLIQRAVSASTCWGSSITLTACWGVGRRARGQEGSQTQAGNGRRRKICHFLVHLTAIRPVFDNSLWIALHLSKIIMHLHTHYW